MIVISNLTVQFGGVRPLDGLSAELTAPIVGLIGPNGAGKTTLLNVLSGFITPLSGRVTIDNIDLLALSPTARVRFGLRRSFQTEQVVEDLSAFDNVRAVLDHVPHPRRAARSAVEAALSYAGLLGLADTAGGRLNLFERRLLEVAKSLVGSPRLILMDEPAAGLNEHEADVLKERIAGIPDSFGARVLLIDHDVELIRSICSQALVLDFGKRLAIGETGVVLDDETVRKAYLGSE